MEEAAEPGEGQPLRGHVEQLDLTLQDLRLYAPYLPGGQGAVDEPGGDAVGVQGVHLVLHQGDQRRDDQRDAAKDEGRQLVAEGLAAAGGHQRQAVAACQDVSDDLRLLG